MKDLLSIAMEISTKEISNKKVNTKSVNERILEILMETPKSKMEIINILALERLEDEMEIKTKAHFLSADVQKVFKGIKVTIQNGFEQSYSNGKNNASFHNNPRYSAYKLVREKTGNTMKDIFYITKA